MGQQIGYARVSTEGQNLDTQIDQLEKNGADKIFQEKVSGSDVNRQELNQLLDYVRSGDTVIVCKLDRIARSTKHLLEIIDLLEQKVVSFKVLNINLDTSTPTGKLMLTMLGAIATFERELMLERQREGIERAKINGKYKGRKPTSMNKKTEVLNLIGSGLTRQQVADELSIGVASVYRILSNEKNTQ